MPASIGSKPGPGLLAHAACSIWGAQGAACIVRRELALLLLEDPDARLRVSHAEVLLRMRCSHAEGLDSPLPGQLVPTVLEGEGAGSSPFVLISPPPHHAPSDTSPTGQLSACVLCLDIPQLLSMAAATGTLSQADLAAAASVLHPAGHAQPAPARQAVQPADMQALAAVWPAHASDADEKLAFAAAFLLLRTLPAVGTDPAAAAPGAPVHRLPLKDLIAQLQVLGGADAQLGGHRVLTVGGWGGPLGFDPPSRSGSSSGLRPGNGSSSVGGSRGKQAMVPSLADFFTQHPKARGCFKVGSAGSNGAAADGAAPAASGAAEAVTLALDRLRSMAAGKPPASQQALEVIASAWEAAMCPQPAMHAVHLLQGAHDAGGLPSFLFDYEGVHPAVPAAPGRGPPLPAGAIAMSVAPTSLGGASSNGIAGHGSSAVPIPGAARSPGELAANMAGEGLQPTSAVNLFPSPHANMSFMEMAAGSGRPEVPQEVASCWGGANGGGSAAGQPLLPGAQQFQQQQQTGAPRQQHALPEMPAVGVEGRSPTMRSGHASMGALGAGLSQGMGAHPWSDPVWLSGSPEVSSMRSFETTIADVVASTGGSSYGSTSTTLAAANGGLPGLASRSSGPRHNTPQTPPSSWAGTLNPRGLPPFPPGHNPGAMPALGSSMGSSSGIPGGVRLHRDSTESCSQHPSPSSASDAGDERTAAGAAGGGGNMDLEAALEAIISYESPITNGPAVSAATAAAAQHAIAQHVAAAVRAASTMQGQGGNQGGAAGGQGPARGAVGAPGPQQAQAPPKSFAAAARTGSGPPSNTNNVAAPAGSYHHGMAGLPDLQGLSGRPQTAAAAAAAAAVANGRGIGGWAAVAAKDPSMVQAGQQPSPHNMNQMSAPAAVAAAAARSAAVAAQQQQQMQAAGMPLTAAQAAALASAAKHAGMGGQHLLGSPASFNSVLSNALMQAGMSGGLSQMGLAAAAAAAGAGGQRLGESRSFMRLSPRLRGEIQQLLTRVPGLKVEDFDDGVLYQLAAKKNEDEAVGALRTLAESELSGIQHLAAYINHVIKHYHLTPGGNDGGAITTPSAAVRASSVPVSCKAMLQKLPLRVYKRLEEVVARCVYMEWKHFDAGVVKVMGQLADLSEDDVYEELDLLENTDLSNVEYMPAYLNKRLNNRLWSRRKAQQQAAAQLGLVAPPGP
uniref:Uncharacterized protein n=1 Tax=Chlamydomonas leiostraca TaxID=1034604 RepID=A0A7S0S3Z7_9CHLO|mmetsp:Transcript_7791/g.19356  ORF Transcript_7791/g.19356 Transcript_7791/m.19356 type:complete len:1184 (+) Transcript_7791:243-3794(+)